MPPTEPATPKKSLEQVVAELGLFPIEAFEFVEAGLGFTVNKIHGDVKTSDASHHVTGRDLCEGLREFALLRWGLMSRTVLSRWNVRRTVDFGKIVFAMVDSGWMSKTDDDTLADFSDVYEFKAAFEAGYRIESKV